jgi:hypothetical protein
LAATGSSLAAYLEEISKIGSKLDAEGQLMSLNVEITNEYPLVTYIIPNKLKAVHVNQLTAQSPGGHPGIG